MDFFHRINKFLALGRGGDEGTKPVSRTAHGSAAEAAAVAWLQRQGLQVALANDGSQAVQEVMHTPFNLILMDLQMPVMDGLQATRTIRTLPNGAEVPIVALTANVFEDDRRRCVEAGMNDFLAKPVSPNLLYATLARWMGATPH